MGFSVGQAWRLETGSGFSVACMGARSGSVLLMVSAGMLVLASGLSRLSQFRGFSRRRGLTLWFGSVLGFGVVLGFVVWLSVGVWSWDRLRVTVLVRRWARRWGSARRGVWVQRHQAQKWGTDRCWGAEAGFGVGIRIGVVVWRQDRHQGSAWRRGVGSGLGLTPGFCVGLGVHVRIGVVVMRQGSVWRRGLVIGVGF